MPLHRFLLARRGRLAAAVAVLLASLGAIGGLAFADSAPPAPSITSGPAILTTTSSATFFFADSQSGVTYQCSLDGAAYTACGDPVTYVHLDGIAHVFRVEAVSNGTASAPASYLWTVVVAPPGINIQFPVNDASYGGSSDWNPGCPAGPGVCGTAYALAGVRSVTVSVEQLQTGLYWNGHSFSSSSLVENTASVTPTDATHASWSLPLPLPQPGGQYLVRVRSTDNLGLSTLPDQAWAVQFGVSTYMGFSASGNAAGKLYPGAAAQPLQVTLSNPYGVPVTVTSLTATPTYPANCGASNFSLTQAVLPSGGITIPAGGTMTLPAQGASAPTIQMLDTNTDQDVCQNATVTFTYSGSSHS